MTSFINLFDAIVVLLITQYDAILLKYPMGDLQINKSINILQSLSDIRYRTGPIAIAYLEFSRIADSYGKIVYTTGSRVEI